MAMRANTIVEAVDVNGKEFAVGQPRPRVNVLSHPYTAKRVVLVFPDGSVLSFDKDELGAAIDNAVNVSGLALPDSMIQLVLEVR